MAYFPETIIDNPYDNEAIRVINIEDILNNNAIKEAIAEVKGTSKKKQVDLPSKEGYVFPIIIANYLEAVEGSIISYNPRKSENNKGLMVPLRFTLSELEVEILKNAANFEPSHKGGSPYLKVNEYNTPSSVVKGDNIAGVLHYVLPVYKTVVVDDETGEERAIKTEEYGLLTVAGYVGSITTKRKKQYYLEVSKYETITSATKDVIVTPFGILRKEKYPGFFYEWIEKSALHRGETQIEAKQSEGYRLLSDMYRKHLEREEERRENKPYQPRLF